MGAPRACLDGRLALLAQFVGQQHNFRRHGVVCPADDDPLFPGVQLHQTAGRIEPQFADDGGAEVPRAALTEDLSGCTCGQHAAAADARAELGAEHIAGAQRICGLIEVGQALWVAFAVGLFVVLGHGNQPFFIGHAQLAQHVPRGQWVRRNRLTLFSRRRLHLLCQHDLQGRDGQVHGQRRFDGTVDAGPHPVLASPNQGDQHAGVHGVHDPVPRHLFRAGMHDVENGQVRVFVDQFDQGVRAMVDVGDKRSAVTRIQEQGFQPLRQVLPATPT